MFDEDRITRVESQSSREVSCLTVAGVLPQKHVGGFEVAVDQRSVRVIGVQLMRGGRCVSRRRMQPRAEALCGTGCFQFQPMRSVGSVKRSEQQLPSPAVGR